MTSQVAGRSLPNELPSSTGNLPKQAFCLRGLDRGHDLEQGSEVSQHASSEVVNAGFDHFQENSFSMSCGIGQVRLWLYL